jgi:BatD DUF11 like domain
MAGYIRRLGLLLPPLVLLAATSNIFAASPSVTAVLSNSEPEVGEPVQLQIKVTGAMSAQVPNDISVDGLEIHYTGPEQLIEMNNFDIRRSVNYHYRIIPLRAGTFKIPPQTIRIGNDSLRTSELALSVTDNSTGAPQGNQGTPNARAGAGRLAFAELVVAKKDAYVGEMVPAEVRLAFDPRAHARLEEGPELSGQGFTTQKWQEPQETMETISGRTYQVYTFKTAISPARTGKFEIGPVEAKALVLIPRRPSAPRTTRPRSPFDLFDMDDPLSDPFFSDPFGSMGQRTELPIRSDAETLDVKPLPPNAPANFSGAIGNFTMAVDAKPRKVQVGDPVTVTATISGRGNFDRMNGPTLEDDHGWHKYPASSKFKQDDDVGISGEKTFDTVIAPNEKKTVVPPFVFAYFDPIKETYETLRSDAVPIQVEGGAAPAATAATAPTRPAAASATPVTPAKPADILYQLNDLGTTRSFLPLYAQSTFWLCQLGPLIVLLGFAGWKIRQAKIGNREAQRLAARYQEMSKLLRELRRGDVSPQAYFSQAARVVQLKASVAKNMSPNAVDAETASKAFDLGENERNRMRALFEKNDELSFSGSGGIDKISSSEREDVLRLIESLPS